MLKTYLYINLVLTVLDFIYGLYAKRSLKGFLIYIPINLAFGLPIQLGSFIYAFCVTFHEGRKNGNVEHKKKN